MSLFKSSYLKFITYRIIKIHFQLEASIYRIVKSYHRLSTFITKLISSINFSVTVPNSLAATTAIVWVEKREKERGREERKRGLKSKGRLWKVHFRLPGKVGQIYRIRKVGSFRRELLGNWKRTDRRLVTSTYPYAARTAQYIVYLIPVYPSVLPVEFHRRFFFFFLPRLGLRVSSLPVGQHAASWHLIFACIPTLRSLNISYPWMLWKKVPGILEELAWNPHESW